MRRSALKRKRSVNGGAITRGHSRERLLRELWAHNLGACKVCTDGECAGPIQGHHLITKQALKKRGLEIHLWDIRNRLPVCERRHDLHTRRIQVIPRDLIPVEAWQFADEIGLRWWLERFYP